MQLFYCDHHCGHFEARVTSHDREKRILKKNTRADSN